jgi:carbon storage regulator
MLVLTRNIQQSILVGSSIRITVTRIDGDQVKLGIEAPDDIVILREEIAPRYAQKLALKKSSPMLARKALLKNKTT